MRLVIARCQVDYVGRLNAHLPMAQRLLLIKADGSISIHSDDRAYKPLNWMSPPCVIEEVDGNLSARREGGRAQGQECHKGNAVVHSKGRIVAPLRDGCLGVRGGLEVGIRKEYYTHRLRGMRFVLRMKTIAFVALIACALFVGACSHDEPAHTTTHTTTSTGYSK